MKNICFLLCLLLGMAVQAQIKIGDNPQNIDPSSVLELESSSRVLVITRVNTAQMNTITPSAGALVYNTDVQCIHYYTGTEWKDICDAVAGSITFTSDDGTVVITSTGGNNYDLKVGQITGMNIVNETVFGADIATATIGERQLAPNSVGSSELQDNTVGKAEIQEAAVGTLEIIDGTIQPSDMQPGAIDQVLTTNAAGNVVWLNKNELGATQADQTTITGAGTAADPIKVADTVIGDILANTNSITVNSNNIAQNTNDITAINTALGTKEDVANKSDDTALGNSTTLYPTQNAVKTYVDQLAGAASTLADGNIFVGSAGNVATGVAMGGDATISNTGVVTIANLAITSPKIALNAVGQPHLASNSVISDKILNGNVTPIKIQPGAANQIMTTNTLGVVSWQPIAAVGGNQDLASVLGFGTSAANNQINNLADPTSPQDAATMAYVDSQTDGSETEINPGTNITITGNGTTATPYVINAADGAVPDGSETEINPGTNITITGNGTTATPYIINAAAGAVADGSETIIDPSPSVAVTGAGTTLSPYVLTVDGSETEINPGTNITITGNGTTATPYVINAASGAVADGSETIIDPSTSVSVAGAGTTLSPYVLTVDGSETIIDAVNSTIGVTGTGTSGNPYVLTGAAGNPDATDVNFTSYISITSPNVQGAIQQLKDEVDGIVVSGGGNPTDELQDLQLTGSILTVTNPATGGNQVDLDTEFATDAELLASIADGDETIITTTPTVTVAGTGTVGNPYTLGVAALGVDTAQLADNAVTSIKITDDNVTLAKLANGTAAGQLMQWNGTDWVLVADTALSLTEADGIIGNEVTDVTNATLERSGAGSSADPFTLGIADLGVNTGQLADNAVTSIKITDDNVTLAKLANGTAAGQLMQWNGTDWVLVADTALSLTEADGIIGNEVTDVTNATLERSGAGSLADPYTLGIADLGVNTGQLADDAVTTAKIANAGILAEDLNQMGATANQVLKWNGANWAPAADAAGTTITPGIGLTLNGTDFDVDDLAGEVTGPTSATVIANDAVTTTKIANAAILAEDLNQMGATANQVLKWNGTNWSPAADAAGTTITPGTGLTLNGTDFDVDDLAGEVTGPTSATVIANDAVTTIKIVDNAITSAKIANGTIVAVDLNQMGATNDQVLKWNGTIWAPAADSGITVTDTDVNDGLTNFSATTGYNINVDGTTIELNADALRIADNGVTSAKIVNGTIAAVDLNQMGAANDQVLKWNGAAWAPAADAGGTTYTAGVGLTLNGTDFDVDNLAGEVTGPTSATVIANNAVTSAKIANGTIAAVDLNQMGAANNQVLKWNGAAWAPAADAGGTTYTAGVGLTLNGTDFDVDNLAGEVTGPTSATVIANDAITSAKIVNGTIAAVDLNQMGAANDQVLKWNGAAWAPAADAGGTTYTAGVGLTLNGTDFDVDNLAGEVTGPTSATVIANDAITSAKIVNGTIAAVDLNQMGAANDQVLKWNGAAWAPAADAGGTTYTAGVGLTLNGTDFDVDNLAGEVTGPTSATVIANDAITSAKIVNGTIAAVDLNQMGAANDQVLKWNGAAWAPAADAGGTTYTAGDALTLTAGDFDVLVDDSTIEVNGSNQLQVLDGGINALQLADGAIIGGIGGSILDNSITAADLAPNSVDQSELQADSVGESELIDEAVTPAKIQPGNADQILRTNAAGTAVSWVDLPATGGTTEFADQNTITGDGTTGNEFQVANGGIDTQQLAADAVTSAQIANGTIVNADISASAAIDGTKIDPDFGGQAVSTSGTLTAGNTTINGTITATNDITTNGDFIDTTPDYVFQFYYVGTSYLNNKYRFKSLKEIEKFTIKNHHLPGIKSADEIKKQGYWSLTEASQKNLEKIEELFLHTIEQEKKIDQLKNENESMSAELQSLRKDMEEIKALLQKQ